MKWLAISDEANEKKLDEELDKVLVTVKCKSSARLKKWQNRKKAGTMMAQHG